MTSLTSTVRNIHRVEANALTQVVDIFAPPYTRQRIRDSEYYALDEAMYQGREGVFEATVA